MASDFLKKISEDLFHADEDVRVLALSTIMQLSPSLIVSVSDLEQLSDSLEKACSSGSPDVRFLARKGLEHLDKLKTRLSEPENRHGTVPEPACRPPVVLHVDANASGKRKELLQLLTSPSAKAREKADAITTLSQLAGPGDIDIIAGLLRHEHVRVRNNAIDFLSVHTSGKRLAELLTPVMSDKSDSVRSNAASALGMIDPGIILGYLEELLENDDDNLRLCAVRALSALDASHPAVKLLEKALNDKNEEVVIAARSALGRKEPAPEEAPPVREETSRSPDEETRPLNARENIRANLDEAAQKLLAGQQGGIRSLQAKMQGLNREGLSSLLESEYRRIGEEIFLLLRSGKISHQKLNQPYYDILKFTEFVKKHREKIDADKGGPERPPRGFISLVKRKLDLKKPPPSVSESEKAIERLEGRIEDSRRAIGEISIRLFRKGALELEKGEEYDKCVSLIEKALANEE